MSSRRFRAHLRFTIAATSRAVHNMSVRPSDHVVQVSLGGCSPTDGGGQRRSSLTLRTASSRSYTEVATKVRASCQYATLGSTLICGRSTHNYLHTLLENRGTLQGGFQLQGSRTPTKRHCNQEETEKCHARIEYNQKTSAKKGSPHGPSRGI